MTTPDENAILEAIREALLTPDRPPRTEGWFSLKELQDITRDDSGAILSVSKIHKRMAEESEKWEKRKVKGYMYYKLRNGKP